MKIFCFIGLSLILSLSASATFTFGNAQDSTGASCGSSSGVSCATGGNIATTNHNVVIAAFWLVGGATNFPSAVTTGAGTCAAPGWTHAANTQRDLNVAGLFFNVDIWYCLDSGTVSMTTVIATVPSNTGRNATAWRFAVIGTPRYDADASTTNTATLTPSGVAIGNLGNDDVLIQIMYGQAMTYSSGPTNGFIRRSRTGTDQAGYKITTTNDTSVPVTTFTGTPGATVVAGLAITDDAVGSAAATQIGIFAIGP